MPWGETSSYGDHLFTDSETGYEIKVSVVSSRRDVILRSTKSDGPRDFYSKASNIELFYYDEVQKLGVGARLNSGTQSIELRTDDHQDVTYFLSKIEQKIPSFKDVKRKVLDALRIDQHEVPQETRKLSPLRAYSQFPSSVDNKAAVPTERAKTPKKVRFAENETPSKTITI